MGMTAISPICSSYHASPDGVSRIDWGQASLAAGEAAGQLPQVLGCQPPIRIQARPWWFSMILYAGVREKVCIVA